MIFFSSSSIYCQFFADEQLKMNLYLSYRFEYGETDESFLYTRQGDLKKKQIHCLKLSIIANNAYQIT